MPTPVGRESDGRTSIPMCMARRMIAALPESPVLPSTALRRFFGEGGRVNIGVVGTGYVGLVVGACLAENGNSVLCVDSDAGKVERLLKGEIPIYEPGLNEMVPRNVAEDRLQFTTDLDAAVKRSEVDLHRRRHPAGRGRLGRPHPRARRRPRNRPGDERLQGDRQQVDRAGRHGPEGARGRGGAHVAPLRRRLEPGVPEGGDGGRRLPEARPRRDRHRRPRGSRRSCGSSTSRSCAPASRSS